tara:strand:+ start:1224 stop:1466 length:243 start_codon:yes stop_codon:yes gene_type:complete
MDIKLKITRGEDQELNLNAKTMNELVGKIIDWQLWENQNLDYYKKKGVLNKEKKSGWYYFNISKPIDGGTSYKDLIKLKQ